MLAGSTMRERPVAAKQPHRAFLFVNDRVDAKRRLDKLRDALALFMDCIPIEQASANAGSAAARCEVQREHVRRFNRLCRSQAGTDRLAASSKSGEVMKVNP